MRKLAAWTAGLILLAGLLAIVGGSREGRAQDGDEIRLGAFAPLSGISADVGAQIRAGIEVAVERATQQGIRVGGKPYRVKVIWYDDEGKADVGLNVVTRALTLDKIHVGVGFLSSDVFLRIMDEFQKARIPIVDACAAAMRIGDRIAQNRMTHVFQLSPTDPRHGPGRVRERPRDGQAEEDRPAEREHRRRARLLAVHAGVVRGQREGR